MILKFARIGGIIAGTLMVYVAFVFLSSISIAPTLYFVNPKTVQPNQTVQIYGLFLHERQYKREAVFAGKRLEASRILVWNMFTVQVKIPPDSSTNVLELYLDNHKVQTIVGVYDGYILEQGVPIQMQGASITPFNSTNQPTNQPASEITSEITSAIANKAHNTITTLSPFMPLRFTIKEPQIYLPLYTLYLQSSTDSIPVSHIVNGAQFAPTQSSKNYPYSFNEWRPYAQLPADLWRRVLSTNLQATFYVQDGKTPFEARYVFVPQRAITSRGTTANQKITVLFLNEEYRDTEPVDGYHFTPHQTMWHTHRIRPTFWKQNNHIDTVRIREGIPRLIVRELRFYALPDQKDMRIVSVKNQNTEIGITEKRTEIKTETTLQISQSQNATQGRGKDGGYSLEELSKMLTEQWDLQGESNKERESQNSPKNNPKNNIVHQIEASLLMDILPDISSSNNIAQETINRMGIYQTLFPHDIELRLTVGLEYRVNPQLKKAQKYDLTYKLWYEVLTENNGWIPLAIAQETNEQGKTILSVTQLATTNLISLYNLEILLFYLNMKKSFYLPQSIAIEE